MADKATKLAHKFSTMLRAAQSVGNTMTCVPAPDDKTGWAMVWSEIRDAANVLDGRLTPLDFQWVGVNLDFRPRLAEAVSTTAARYAAGLPAVVPAVSVAPPAVQSAVFNDGKGSGWQMRAAKRTAGKRGGVGIDWRAPKLSAQSPSVVTAAQMQAGTYPTTGISEAQFAELASLLRQIGIAR